MVLKQDLERDFQKFIRLNCLVEIFAPSAVAEMGQSWRDELKQAAQFLRGEGVSSLIRQQTRARPHALDEDAQVLLREQVSAAAGRSLEVRLPSND